MIPLKKHRNCCYPLCFALLFLLLGPGLLPPPVYGQTLRIVYGNDNLGELAPCG